MIWVWQGLSIVIFVFEKDDEEEGVKGTSLYVFFYYGREHILDGAKPIWNNIQRYQCIYFIAVPYGI